MTTTIRSIIVLLAAAFSSAPALAGPPNCTSAGMVQRNAKISSTFGNFSGPLANGDTFGIGLASLGDVDHDGVVDLVVGAYLDDDGGADRGAAWILFLNPDGSVKASQKISDLAGNFNGVLDNSDGFGVGVAGLGDIDGDSVPDLAVGSYLDDDGGTDRGAVWVLLLNSDGTVKAEQKISDTVGGFNGVLDNVDGFGVSVAGIGDLDGDGIPDLGVGSWLDDDGGSDRGGAWVLFLNANGTVKAEQKISDTAGGFNGVLDNADHFGRSIAGIGDLDGDMISEIAIGADFDDDGSSQGGAAWILFMNANGTVRAEQKISATTGGFVGNLTGVQFGYSLASVGDLDGDGIQDLAVGAVLDDTGGTDRGAVWILSLNTNGTVLAQQKISSFSGNFTGVLDSSDYFGSAMAGLGDIDGDCVADLATGAWGDDDGGLNRGAIWILSLNGCLPREICCPGNADRLGGVNFADITAVLTNFGLTGSPCTQNAGDADCNGSVNFADITAVLTNFTASCP